MVAQGDIDQCLHCKQDLKFGNKDGDYAAYRRPRWVHVATEDMRCADGDRRAKPVHWCDERMSSTWNEETCNRPIKEFGKCGIHCKDARADFERQQKVDQIHEQDDYVQETLGTLIEYWNEAYDLDAKLVENHDGTGWHYRSGQPRYTGYVQVNPARLTDLMSKIEEEFT